MGWVGGRDFLYSILIGKGRGDFVCKKMSKNKTGMRIFEDRNTTD